MVDRRRSEAEEDANTQRGAAAAATKKAQTQGESAETRRLEAEQSLLDSYRARVGTQLEQDGAEALKVFDTP